MTDKTHFVDDVTGHRRMRRLRKADWQRRMVQENRLTVDDLIWPIFVVPGTGVMDPHRRHARRFPDERRHGGLKRPRKRPISHSGDRYLPECRHRPARRNGSHILVADNLINQTTAHQESCAQYRHHHRRGARPVHQPRA